MAAVATPSAALPAFHSTATTTNSITQIQTQTQTQTQSPASLPVTTIPRGATSTELTYYAPPADGSAPYNVVDPLPGQRQMNYRTTTLPVTIHDARGQESSFSTDKQGFALLHTDVHQEFDFSSDEQIQKSYYPTVEKLLLENLPGNPTQVVFFDHTVRRADPGAKRGPVQRVHIDQTAKSAAQRVRRHLGDQAEELLQGRVRIVNVWRPLNGPVVSSPLAMAASDSVAEEEVVAVEHRYRDKTGETAGIKPSERHQWYYWSGMGNQERILLQCYDSLSQKRVPHTAFQDPRTAGPEWRARESIEVRALVFG
ncbi:hypothetical protein ANO11243_080010 [Dothideomycetidae sp. 11243]|nr:hypothetical protein ANO11243_080010 [fungal sp. No.11243]